MTRRTRRRGATEEADAAGIPRRRQDALLHLGSHVAVEERRLVHLIEEAHHRLGLGVFQLKAVQGDIQGHVAIKLHQTARDADLLGIVQKRLAPLGLLDLTRAGQKRIQIAVFLNEKGRGLEPDARRAGDVVGGIAGQRLHLHARQVGLQAPFQGLGVPAQGGVAHVHGGGRSLLNGAWAPASCGVTV